MVTLAGSGAIQDQAEVLRTGAEVYQRMREGKLQGRAVLTPK